MSKGICRFLVWPGIRANQIRLGIKKEILMRRIQIFVLFVITVFSIVPGQTNVEKPIEEEQIRFTHLGKISADKPAFLYLEPNGSGQNSLIITHFKLIGNGKVTAIHQIGTHLNSLADAQAEVWTSIPAWPNEIKRIPDEIFGPHHFTIAGGFLVPGKANGSIKVFRCEILDSIRKDLCTQYGEAGPDPLTKSKRGWWYHRARWSDLNADGRLDLISARARKPMFGKGLGELLWLEQPENPFIMPWKEHLIGHGPDVHFLIEDFDGDDKVEILSTEFFQKRLSLFYQIDGVWESKILDQELGSGFDLAYVDLNGDSKPEILATNHENNNRASVFAYEIPQKPLEQEWKRHTLLTGIETRQGGMGQGSPGAATAFYPNTNSIDGKPWILVSGDGSQRAHLLRPISDEYSNWTYEESILVDAGCTVGHIAIGDVDSDGWVEIFVPAYDSGSIEVFTSSPKASKL